LRRASKALATTGITSRLRDLTGQVVTEGLRKGLEKELKAIGGGHLPVRLEARGTKGRTQLYLQLRGAAPSVKVLEVFSEGEQRAVSLAFFLAEVGAAEHDGGIIFDDPVSSLDHLRRKYVAVRLTEEAQRRQMIVFTHDLVFLKELTTQAEEAGVQWAIRSVQRVAGAVGVTNADLPWRVKKLTDQVKALKGELPGLAALEAQGSEEYFVVAKAWIGRLRDAWERAVEERLLNRVVERFDPGVHTKRLDKMKKYFSAELAGEVTAAMTETSRWEHDQADAVNVPPPGAAELEGFLEQLEDFLKRVPG